MSLISGARLGPYLIMAPLGTGGMGEVYRARDPRLDREVAIKVLREYTARDPESLVRFKREAKAVAALSHPNILAIYDIGEEGEVFFAVMELLDGETLRAKLQGGALPPRRVLEYARQIAEGLAAAHEKGIIHRDLKPENLFVTPNHRVKILDFGLAKQFTPASDEAIVQKTTPTRSLDTKIGTMLGTVGYMAPEQVRGVSVDHRADLFSYGAVLYEMLHGHRAFTGDSAVETMNSILNGQPNEIDSSARNIPPGVMALVRHCLEKDPAARYQTARDLAYNLETLTNDSATSGAKSGVAFPATRRHWARNSLAALALIIVAGVTGVAGSRLSTRRTVPLKYNRLTFRQGKVIAARFAHDGKGAVYSALWKGEAESHLFSAAPGSTEALALSPLDAELLAVSSKGEMAVRLRSGLTIDRTRRGVLARMAVNGGTPRELKENVDQADWSPDGESLAVTLNLGDHYRLEYPIGNKLYETDGWISDPAISPDGKSVAFVDHPLFGEDHGTIAVIAKDGKKQTLTGDFNSVQGLRWEADGKRLWTAASEGGGNRGLLLIGLNGTMRRMLSSTVPMILFDRAPDGRLLLGSGADNFRLAGKLSGDEREKDYTWMDGSKIADISPDGNHYLFTEQGEGGGAGYAVYLGSAGIAVPIRLGSGQAFGFSPDGTSALTLVPDSNPSKLRLLPVGSGEPKEITIDDLRVRDAVYHPSGKELFLLAAAAGSSPRIWRVPLAGGKPAPVTEEHVLGLAISPDGHWLLASDFKKDAWRLIALDGGASHDVKLPAPPSATGFVAFTPDSLGVFFRDTDPATRKTLFKVDLATGESAHWRELDDANLALGRIREMVLSPDGNSYIYSFSHRQVDLFEAEPDVR